MTTTINASNSGSGGLIQTADASGILALQTAGTTAVTVDTSQNVGVGTASPAYKLDVQSTASTGAPLLANFQAAGGDVQLYVQNGTVKTQLTADATNSASIVGSFSAHPLVFRTSNTERMRITVVGYVGIGTSSPAALLHVGTLNGTGSINGYTKFALEATDYAVATWKSPAANFSQIIFTDTTNTSLGGINYFNSTNATPNAMAFLTANAERMRITSAGYVGIGTSSPTQTLMLGSGYIQTGQGVGGGGGVRFPYSSDASGRTWRARSDITGYGDFGLEQSTSQTGDTYATRLLITQAGVLQFNSGYGSAATAYGCRVWCQYNQSATIIGAGNVSSITIITTGDVRLNFATALVDANYSAVATTNESGGGPKWCNSTQPSTTDIRIVTFNADQSKGWFEYNSVAVFR
jgi:hypothetical protein